MDSVRSTWKTINEFALAHKTTPQELVDKQVNDVLRQMSAAEQDRQDESACKCIHTSSVYACVHVYMHLFQLR